MIKYRLACDKDHSFDAWFANSDAYDKQRKRGLVVCPTCDSKKVSKSLMAPAVGVRQNKKSAATAARATPAPQPDLADGLPVSSALGDKQRALLALMREVRKEVAKNAEYVGPRFAEEARKIHHEEAPERGIYGTATPEEAKALIDDGIEAYPLPTLPEDKN
jgi:hypothetical protein